jgi:hypothetical protein
LGYAGNVDLKKTSVDNTKQTSCYNKSSPLKRALLALCPNRFIKNPISFKARKPFTILLTA